MKLTYKLETRIEGIKGVKGTLKECYSQYMGLTKLGISMTQATIEIYDTETREHLGTIDRLNHITPPTRAKKNDNVEEA